MVYYKAFRKGMVCKGKQYAENTDYEEKGANACCHAGVMHFCKEPFDVLNYYPLVDENGDFSEYATVEPKDEVLKKDDKCASKKIHIGAKLGFKGFIEAAVNVIIEKTKEENNSDDHAHIGSSSRYAQIGLSGDYAHISSSGDNAHIGSSGYNDHIGSSGDNAYIGSSGDFAKIGSSGDYAKIGSSDRFAHIGSSGNHAQIGSSGHCAQISSSGDNAYIGSSGGNAKIDSSGDFAQIGSSGNYAHISSSGHYAHIGSSGYCVQIGSSGDYARIKMEGERCVASCVGSNGRIKGKLGCWIVLSEWNIINDKYTPVCVKAAKIDGEELKPDIWYKLENGEFVEA